MTIEEIFTERILSNYSKDEIIALNDILHHGNETKQAVLFFRLSNMSIHIEVESGLYELKITKPYCIEQEVTNEA